jgi:predicted RNA-binding protein with PIN domain
MLQRTRYLIVDGHSVIFAWPELRKIHERRSSLAREALTRQLRDYQDWTGVRVVIVFDGKGAQVSSTSGSGDVQIFYSRSGQTADAIIERLASKYAGKVDLTVATSDFMERQTVHASGAKCISPEALREAVEEARLTVRRKLVL